MPARKPASSTARKPASPPVAKPAGPVVDLGARPVTYWFPSLTLASGQVVHCKHSRYGHESEAAAKRCASSLLAQHASRSTQATPAASQPPAAARKLRSGAAGQTKAA